MKTRRRPPRLRLFRQGLGFAAAEASVAALGAVSTALAARMLSTGHFGELTFAVSLLSFTSLFFDFGLFLPTSRLLAGADEDEQREIAGGSIVAFVPIGLLFAGAVFAASFVVDRWFHLHVGSVLRIAAVLSFVYPLSTLAGSIAQGSDRLHRYSVTVVVAQALYVVPLTLLVVTKSRLDVALILELRLAAMLVSLAIFLVWLKPVFRSIGERVRRVVRHARDYGFNVYVGSVLGIATFNMDVLMVGALAGPKEVAYYGLAGSFAYMVSLPVYGMCKALFPRLTTAGRLDGRWIAASAASGLICALVVVILARPAISIIFSDRYLPALALVPLLALAEAVRGVTTVYNTFLSAQGRGKELRSAALVLTASNLALNFALIPPLGALGAAWASLGALLFNFAAHVVLYRRYVAAPAAVASA